MYANRIFILLKENKTKNLINDINKRDENLNKD